MEQKSLLSYTPMHKCIMWPRYFFNKELQVVTRTRHLHKPATVKRRSVVTLFISLIKISEKAIFFYNTVTSRTNETSISRFIYLFIRNSYCASHAEGFNVHLAEISSEPTAKIFEELQILNLYAYVIVSQILDKPCEKAKAQSCDKMVFCQRASDL